jgi:hypothetical protein
MTADLSLFAPERACSMELFFGFLQSFRYFNFLNLMLYDWKKIHFILQKIKSVIYVCVCVV